jgi:hypothetical protein
MTYVAVSLAQIVECAQSEAGVESASSMSDVQGPGVGSSSSQQALPSVPTPLETAQGNSMHALFQFTHKVERSLEQLVQCILSALCASHFAITQARAMRELYDKTVAGFPDLVGPEKIALGHGYLSRIVEDHVLALARFHHWQEVARPSRNNNTLYLYIAQQRTISTHLACA